jgi:hypothetical protein
MFCPVCKAEYRQGITVCADCNVALVPALPDLSSGRSGPFATLWEGDDLALYTNLTKALDDAGIRHYDGPQRNYMRKESLFWLEGASPIMFSLAVWQADWEAARRILEELLDQEPEDVELPAADSPDETTEERPQETELPGNWDPATAAVPVWSGGDRKMAQFLASALRESGIPIRTEELESQPVICVRPSDAARAQEIVREVVEGTPPT